MRSLVVVRYSIAFKRQVVSDVESKRFRSMEELAEHYGIGGKSTVRRWLKRFGQDHLLTKVVRVEKPDEADQIVQLRKELRQLREALGQTQLQNIMNESFLRIACRKMGVDFEEFKKKVGTMPSGTPTGEAQQR